MQIIQANCHLELHPGTGILYLMSLCYQVI
ncbi:hypothetical protein NC651_040419 [Populus alba x Populus x berolinensis]|nr:hypothetical protein NC651_040419 [Populus alba x Populus x berolinensis]